MIQTFADKRTEQVFSDMSPTSLPVGVIRKARFLLAQLDAAETLDDMRVPPGNKLHALVGKRKGQHAVWINNQWRLVFRFRDAIATEVAITDYHDDKK